jgi:choline dehydrogenase
MQDNYEVPMMLEAEEPWVNTNEYNCTSTFDESDPCFVLWQETQSGPYGHRSATFTANFRSSVSWNQDADIVFLSVAGMSGTAGFFPGYSTSRSPEPRQWGSVLVKMQTGNAAGTVKLRSKDPREAPEINFNYFSEQTEHDMQAFIEAMDFMFGVFDEAGVPYTTLLPNPEADIRQEILTWAFSHHAASSCRMGPAGHKDYCVDSKFRVNGVDALRVVDASVFPRLPGAMINGPTFTVSRKAFETILEDA